MKNIVVLDHLNHFNICQILESGQVFRFDKISEHSYLLNVKQKVIKITQQPGSSTIILYNTNIGELEELWSEYFDLNTNYAEIAGSLAAKDDYMAKAVAFGEGIRLLRQDPWEMLISFIISQNKAIPHIKECIKNLSEQFGTPIHTEDLYDLDIDHSEVKEKKYYTFPTAKELSRASEEDLRKCKIGFRAPYIIDACQKVLSGEILLNDFYIMSAEEAKNKLMTIKGVGPKIADCILLFGYSKMEVFPTDVWIKRVIEGIYFGGREMALQDIQAFAKEYYGDLAGYAQQYLFFYGRENALFKEKAKTREKQQKTK